MLLIVTGVCLGCVGCGGTSSSAPPVTGAIAYLRGTGTQIGGQLVVMRVDGSRKRVLRHTFVDTTPVWSPDGSRIAFFSILDKNREHTFIDVVDRNAGGLRLLTPRSWLEDCSWPVWTNDSSTVAFTRNLGCDGDIGIYTVRADGTRLRAFFDPIGSDLAWSPDGRTVSYLGRRSALKSDLRLMDIDGSNRRGLTAADVLPIGGVPTTPPTAWSPDGSRIYYIDANQGISVIHRDNTRRRRVVTTTPQTKIGQGIYRVIEFALSPNGKLIAFCAGDGKNKNLYVVHADGSGLQKLANMSMDPSWSPDGKWIAFDGTPKGTRGQIWIVNSDGRNLRDLSNDASDDYAPAWAPATR